MDIFDLFAWLILFNGWTAFGYFVLYLLSIEPRNLLEGILGSILWPAMAFMRLMDWVEKTIEKA